jgi:hypothetical protein
MMNRRGVQILPLVAVFLSGCSQKPTTPAPSDVQHTELNDIWDMYSAYSAQYKKPPAKLEDLRPLAAGSPLGGRALNNKDYVVLYGTPVGGDQVLAYQKDVLTAGGLVLLANGDVKKMTADEFKAAPKGGK